MRHARAFLAFFISAVTVESVAAFCFAPTGLGNLCAHRGYVQGTRQRAPGLKLQAKKGKKKPANKTGPTVGGFGAKTQSVTKSVDAAALLRKSMDLYDVLSKEEASREVNVEDDAEDEPGMREYVVVVRGKGYDAVNDWVPAACMGVMWSGGEVTDNPLLRGIANHNMFAPIAAKLHCREVWESACQSSPSLRKIPRNAIEYAFEPLDNFGEVIEEVNSKGGATLGALHTLGLKKGASASEIKAAHRKLILTLHPDRVSSLPEEEQASARAQFEAVQDAYEVLGGGSGDATKSWYENLGSGRADFFSGAIDLSCPIDGGLLDYWTAAVCPLDCELTNKFITRNVMRAKLAAVA